MRFVAIILSLLLSSCASHYEIVMVHPEKQFPGSDKITKEISNLDVSVLVVSEENADLITNIKYQERIISGNGVIDINFPQVEFAGGYFNACLKNAVISWSENRNGQGTAIINMKRVYFGRFRTLYQEYKDNYINDDEFISYLQTQSFRGMKSTIKIKGDYIICQLHI